jgi:hypothetical protein
MSGAEEMSCQCEVECRERKDLLTTSSTAPYTLGESATRAHRERRWDALLGVQRSEK